MISRFRTALLSLPILLVLFYISAQADVYTVDLGRDTFKVGVASASKAISGSPLDMLLNEESKRKTQTAIAKEPASVTSIGSTALRAMQRFPDRGVSHFSWLYSGDVPEGCERPEGSLGWMCSTEAGNITLSDALAFTSEYVAKLSGEGNFFVLVPPGSTIQDRTLLYTASELGLDTPASKLNMKGLVSTTTGIAASYILAQGRAKKTPENEFIILDIGAYDVCATDIMVQTSSEKKSSSTYAISVGNTECEHGIGGDSVTDALYEELVQRVRESAPPENLDMLQRKRVLRRIKNTAERTKMVLSANNDTPVSIENLLGDWDFRTKMDRSIVEEAVRTMIGKPGKLREFVSKIITIDPLNQKKQIPVILVGGGSRIPALGQILAEELQGFEIKKNVNLDEGPALGSAFLGALKGGMRARTNIEWQESVPAPGLSVRAGLHYPLNEKEIPRKPSIMFAAGKNCPATRSVSFAIPDVPNWDVHKEIPTIEIATWQDDMMIGGSASICRAEKIKKTPG